MADRYKRERATYKNQIKKMTENMQQNINVISNNGAFNIFNAQQPSSEMKTAEQQTPANFVNKFEMNQFNH